MVHRLRQMVITVGAPAELDGREGRRVLADFYGELSACRSSTNAGSALPERKTSAEEVLLAETDWGFPRFTLQRVSEGRRQASSVHVDLTAQDRLAEVARLAGLGATEGATHGDEQFGWTVMRDPDGNEFCVTG